MGQAKEGACNCDMKRIFLNIESLRLEKASKIIKSNSEPNTILPAKPCPETQEGKPDSWNKPYLSLLLGVWPAPSCSRLMVFHKERPARG